MAPKVLPPAKINPKKLLGSSRISATVKKISTESLTDGIYITKDDLSIIKKQVITIKDLIKDNYLLKKAEENRKRKLDEQKEFGEREKKLEEKPQGDDKEKAKLPSTPKLSFLDRIKKFLFNVLLGYVVVKLLPHAPKLMGVVSVAGKALDFLSNLGVGFVDTLGTFIQKGYEAYDFTKKTLKSFGGDKLTNLFDGFNGAVGKLIEASIIAALAFGDLGGGDDSTPGVKTQKPTGPSRNFVQRGARKAFVGVLGKGGAKSVLKAVRPFLKRLPIPVIGALIDFGLSVALGEKPGRAAFKSIGAGLAGIIGTAIGSLPPLIPFGGPLIGGILGGWAGDALGSALYDMFFGGKAQSGGKVPGYAGGGAVTRGGKLISGPTRQVKKTRTKRSVKVELSKLNAGENVGGENKIEKMFPASDKPDVMNPLGYVEGFYNKSSDIPFFGPLFTIAAKTLLGDKPSSVDYKNAGIALNSWMNNTFSSEVMRGGGMFAGGGEVNAEMFMNGEDLSNIIAKSIEESASSKIDESIKDLMKQLALRQPVEDPKKSDPTIETEDDMPTDGTGGQWGPLLDLIAGKESGGNYEAMYPSTTLKGATKMTIAEVARRATGAVGKYQQLPQYLVGRAKAAGLDPNKDLYSPENQDLIITKVNIKGRGGERWLRGEISDEQFMQGLSQEFASLPNARGVFYYPGQRSSMTPDKVKMALSKVKKGGYVDKGTGLSPDMQLGKGYGKAGSKIAGELGRFIKQKLQSPRDFQAITEHPEHGGIRGRHATRSFHYEGRALDIGAYTHEQGPILKVISEFNKKMGVKPVELLHGRNEPGGHSDHVHVAYSKGGLVDGVTYAMLGERGREFIIDADSTAAIENTFPGFLNALNKANYDGVIQVLRNYAEYEFGSMQEVIVEQPEPEIVYVPMPVPQQQIFSSGGSSGRDPSYDNSYMMG